MCQNSDNFDCKSDSSADSQSNSHLFNAVVMSDESDIVPSVECKQTQHSSSFDNDNTVDGIDDQADVLIEDSTDNLVSSSVVAQEQQNDETLKGCFKLAEKGKGHFVTHNGLLYHQDKILGQAVSQLVVPKSRPVSYTHLTLPTNREV